MVNAGVFYDQLEYFMAIWYNLWPFGIIYGRFVQFVVICYIFPNLVCLDQEKSGNPAVLSLTQAFALIVLRKIQVVNFLASNISGPRIQLWKRCKTKWRSFCME
jgi:hypothetical protein